MFGRLRAFVRDESGQDLIEYGLLSALIGVCAILVWTNFPGILAAVYGSWDGSVQAVSSCTPDPGGGGC